MHPAFLYLPGDRLQHAELGAARLDGHLVEIGEGYIPADLVEGPSTRASAVAVLIPPDTAACGPTAAWIHGAGSAPPAIHHVRRAVARRIRPALAPRVVLHDTSVATEDLVHLGGIAVVSPLRTVLDIALALHRDESLRLWLVRLAEVSPELIPLAIDAVEGMRRVPGTRTARAVLQRLDVRRR